MGQHQALALPAQNQSQQKFMTGYALCAKEVTRYISSSPDIDLHVSKNLLSHLGSRLSTLDAPAAQPTTTTTSPAPSVAPTRPITVTIPVPLTPPSSPINLSKHQHYSAPVSVIVPNTVTPPASPEPYMVQPQHQLPALLSPPRPAHQRVPQPAASPVWRPF